MDGEFERTSTDMNRAITRNEMARILIRVDEKINGNYSVVGTILVITDFWSIPPEYQSYAVQAYVKGLLTGDKNGNFNGDKALNRAEAATVLKRLMDAAGKSSVTPEKGVSGAEMTGELVTVKFTGTVECRDSFTLGRRFCPAGIEMMMLTVDGRVLGTTVSYEPEVNEYPYYLKDSSYTMEATMDKADVVCDSNVYFMVCTYIDADGVRYSNIHNDVGMGKRFHIPSYAIWQIAPYDFTGNSIDFSVGNSSYYKLDF